MGFRPSRMCRGYIYIFFGVGGGGGGGGGGNWIIHGFLNECAARHEEHQMARRVRHERNLVHLIHFEIQKSTLKSRNPH